MNIVKKMIPCDCRNTSCAEFATCCFVATEVVRVGSGDNANSCNDNDIDVMFIGQGAGRDEDFNMNPKNVLRQPFIGRAGAYLRNMVKSLWDNGLRFNLAISNSVRFHPRDANGKDRAPTADELAHCLPILDRDIDTIRPKLLITLGMSTTNALIPSTVGASMGKIVGNAYNYRNIKTLPLYHPSFLVRCYGKFKPTERGEFHVKCMEVLRENIAETRA